MSRTDKADQARALPITLGTHVEIELVNEAGDREQLAVDLVLDAEADFARGFLGAGTPLAQAIAGHHAGETLPYRAGDIVRVRILTVRTAVAEPPPHMEAHRKTVIADAVARSEALDDAAFALAAGSKWGAYDPAAIPPNGQPSAPGRKEAPAQKRGAAQRKTSRT